MTISMTLPAYTRGDRLQQFLADEGIDSGNGIELLRMVRAVSNAYDSALAEELRNDNLTLPRWRLLLWLWMEERGGNDSVNPTHLSRVQQVSKNTISDHLRSLEDAGLIERQLDHDDRRQFIIRLTAAGRTAMLDRMPRQVRMLNDLIADLTETEVQLLLTLLGKLHASLRRSQPESTCSIDREEQP